MQVIVTVSCDQALPDLLGHLPAATGPVLLAFTVRYWRRSDVFVKRSHARIASAWERRNSDQAGPLRRGARSMSAFFRISHTVDAEIRAPSPASSPWILR